MRCLSGSWAARRVVAVAVVASAGVLPMPRAHADAGITADWTSPSKPTAYPYSVGSATAGSGGIAYFGGSPVGGVASIFYRPTGASSDTEIKGTAGQPAICGSSLIYRADDDHYTFVDLTNGSSVTREGIFSTNVCGSALSLTSGSPVTVVLHHPDGTDDTLPSVSTGMWDAGGATAIDDSGFAFLSYNSTLTQYKVWYYDLTTTTARQVYAGAGSPPQLVVTPHDIVWMANSAVFRAPRAGGAVVSAAVPQGTLSLTATDELTAFDRGTNVVLRDSLGKQTTVSVARGGVFSDGTKVLHYADHDLATAGFSQIDSDGTVQRLFPIPPVPYQIWPYSVGPTSLLYQDDSAVGEPSYIRTLTDTGTGVEMGPEVPAPGVRGDSPLLYDGTVSVVSGGPLGAQVVIRRGGTIVQTVDAVPPVELSTSGERLLITPDSSYGLLVDVVQHWVTRVPRDASIWGPYIVYSTTAGIFRRDMTHPSATPTLIEPSPCGTTDCVTQTLTWGDWVAWWKWPGYTVRNVKTGATFSIQGQRGQLADGTFIMSASTGLDLTPSRTAYVDLEDPTHTPHGIAPYAGDAFVEEHLVVWDDYQDRLLRIGRLPYDATTPPTAIYMTPETAFSPNADHVQDVWPLEVDSSKALSAWQATLRDSSDRTIGTWTGSTASGEVLVTWDGRDTAGVQVPDGTYTLTVTGTAADGSGALTDPITGAPPQTTATVHREQPSTALAAPALSTTASATSSVPVSWKMTTPSSHGYRPAAFDVAYQTRYRTGSGAWAWTQPRAWRTNTTTTAGRFRGLPGVTYRFKARAIDTAGNRASWAVHSPTAVPLDDRNRSIHWSGGWAARTRQSGRFLGSLHTSSESGASMTVSAYSTQLSIVGDRCRMCGTFTVIVDGHVVANVRSGGAAAHRAVLYRRALSKTVRRHRVQIIVRSGTVRLDAIGFRH